MSQVPQREEALSGWGRHAFERCRVYRPERASALTPLLRESARGTTFIGRGLGRSYGDAALNRDGVLLATRLDRMLDFDPETGVLTCEAGVSLADILATFVPRGWFFPVTPGTKFVSVGGAIAADVHGKNHHDTGSLSAWLLDFDLVTASGDCLRCSHEENPALFWATVGGMGLTGIVTRARLRLRPIESAWMWGHYERSPDLDTTLDRCLASDEAHPYGVIWLDCLARGRSLGRSVAMRADHAPACDLPPKLARAPLALASHLDPLVPFTLPDFTLSRLSMSVFNALFYRVQPEGRRLVDCERYFYPLDRIRQWNRIYGRRGVLQYQCSLPSESARTGLRQILERLTRARRSSFLAVLKSFGPGSEGLLSFPQAGFTLALDLPYTGSDLIEALHELDRIVASHGGRVYLAKDACLEQGVFEEMYPRHREFREVKAKVDPEGRFASAQARRLGLVEARRP